MSGSDMDERALQIARLEVKVDTILEHLKEDRETMKERFSDHEERLRKLETRKDVAPKVEDLEKRVVKTERWVHAIPVVVVIGFIVAVGGLLGYVNTLTP